MLRTFKASRGYFSWKVCWNLVISILFNFNIMWRAVLGFKDEKLITFEGFIKAECFYKKTYILNWPNSDVTKYKIRCDSWFHSEILV